MRVIRRSLSAMTGLIIVALLLAAAAFAPVLAPYDVRTQNLAARLAPPSLEHPFGTDRVGRDIFSRVRYGARLSLLVAVGAVALGSLLGVTFGMIAGYSGRWVDGLMMRAVDIMLAFPLILVALVISGVLGPSLGNLILAIAIASFPSFARIARGETLSIARREYIESAHALGVRLPQMLFRHILPNIFGPILVAASLAMGTAILVEASLSFLGLGLSPPAPAWGLMINDGLQVIRSAWWVSLFPGLAITITVLGFSLLGDGLRDAFDPRLQQ